MVLWQFVLHEKRVKTVRQKAADEFRYSSFKYAFHSLRHAYTCKKKTKEITIFKETDSYLFSLYEHDPKMFWKSLDLLKEDNANINTRKH